VQKMISEVAINLQERKQRCYVNCVKCMEKVERGKGRSFNRFFQCQDRAYINRRFTINSQHIRQVGVQKFSSLCCNSFLSVRPAIQAGILFSFTPSLLAAEHFKARSDYHTTLESSFKFVTLKLSSPPPSYCGLMFGRSGVLTQPFS
jgi:hypothetical protein